MKGPKAIVFSTLEVQVHTPPSKWSLHAARDRAGEEGSGALRSEHLRPRLRAQQEHLAVSIKWGLLGGVLVKESYYLESIVGPWFWKLPPVSEGTTWKAKQPKILGHTI